MTRKPSETFGFATRKMPAPMLTTPLTMSQMREPGVLGRKAPRRSPRPTTIQKMPIRMPITLRVWTGLVRHSTPMTTAATPVSPTTHRRFLS